MNTGLHTIDAHGYPISHQDNGPPDAPVVVLMSGWCHDHRLFDQLVPHLEADLRVLCVDWRGHGADRSPVADFGYPSKPTTCSPCSIPLAWNGFCRYRIPTAAGRTSRSPTAPAPNGSRASSWSTGS